MFSTVRFTHPPSRRRPQGRKRSPFTASRGWPRPPFAPAAALVVCSLVAAGCGAGGSDGGAEGAGRVDETQTPVVEIERILFGAGEDLSEEEQRAYMAELASGEERIARCMAAAGFDYFPVSADVNAFSAAENDFLSREYAEQYGFGYTTRLDDPSQWNSSDFVDPNNDYVESLTESERNEYYVALHGDRSWMDGIESEEERIALEQEQPELFAPSGCYAEARSAQSIMVEEVWAEFGTEIGALYADAENHALVQEPLRKWSSCMADHGHQFATPDDFDTVMDPYLNRLYETAVYAGSDLTEEDFEAMTDEQRDELWSQPPVYDQNLLAEAQQYEIELAVTSYDCGLPTLYDAYRDALTELQQRFIEDNLDRLQPLTEG